MEIVYLGPDGEGEEIPGETYVRPAIFCPRDVAVEVPDDIATSLLQLEHKWRKATPGDQRPGDAKQAELAKRTKAELLELAGPDGNPGMTKAELVQVVADKAVAGEES